MNLKQASLSHNLSKGLAARAIQGTVGRRDASNDLPSESTTHQSVLLQLGRYLRTADQNLKITEELSCEATTKTGATGFSRDGKHGQGCSATDPAVRKELISVSASAKERPRLEAVVAESLNDILAEIADHGFDSSEGIRRVMNP